MLIATHAWAVTLNWTNPGTGDWFDGDNWCCEMSPPPDQMSLPPAAFDDVRINNGGTVQLSLEDAAILSVYVGQYPGQSGAIEVYGGQLTSGPVWLRDFDTDEATGGSGTIRLIEGGRWVNWGDMTIGMGGTGRVEIQGGKLATSPTGTFFGGYQLGNLPGSMGTVVVEDRNSMDGKWTTHLNIEVGYRGTGKVNVKAGGEVRARDLYIGSRSESIDNEVTVEGMNSKVVTTRQLRVGIEGKGKLDIRDGAHVSSASGSIGPGSTATVDQAVWDSDSSLFVDGGLDVNQGGVVTARSLVINSGGIVNQRDTGRIVLSDDIEPFPAGGGLYVGRSTGIGNMLALSNRSKMTATAVHISGPAGTRASADGVETLLSGGNLTVGDGQSGQLWIEAAERSTP